MFLKTRDRIFINTKYIMRELAKKIGMYLRPFLILPFSTIDTIREEKNEIIDMAAIEKYLKLSGSTATCVNVNGSDSTLDVTAASLVTNPSMIIRRWNDSENSKGAITITSAAMKIVYATTEADMSSFNDVASLKFSTILSIRSAMLPPLSNSLIIRSTDLLSIGESYFSPSSFNALPTS